jgi:hypothetical protein
LSVAYLEACWVGADKRVDARLREPQWQADRTQAGAFRRGCGCHSSDLGAERVELACTSFDPGCQPCKLALAGWTERGERTSHHPWYDLPRSMGQSRERN